MSYLVHRIPQDVRPDFSSPLWSRAEIAPIARFPWDENGYRPKAQGRCLWNENGVYILLEAWETNPRATVTQPCGPVCQDSCLECFFQPYPDADPRYLNLEVNPLATLYCAVRPNRFSKTLYPDPPHGMQAQARQTETFWSALLFVPMPFLCETFGQPPLESGARLRGNFYTCGDQTPFPHYGVWAPVLAEKPDFHRPECFADWRLA